MNIAVPYENGSVFQHFGHTEQFKIYQAENGAVVSSQVVDTNGSGHGALAGFLSAHKVDCLLCGRPGGGRNPALRRLQRRRGPAGLRTAGRHADLRRLCHL